LLTPVAAPIPATVRGEAVEGRKDIKGVGSGQDVLLSAIIYSLVYQLCKTTLNIMPRMTGAERLAVQLPRAHHTDCQNSEDLAREAVGWNGGFGGMAFVHVTAWNHRWNICIRSSH
jgi:hypothetical protein